MLPWRTDSVREVAEQIPRGWLQAYDNDGPGLPPGISPAQALDRLAETTGVVRLKHLELVPGYRRPVAEIVSAAAAIFTPDERVTRHSSVVFVGNGGSSAPWHIDLQPNLFVHLSGLKRFTIGGLSDDRATQELVLRMFRGRAEPRPELDEVAAFELEAGDALYVPPFTFHSVETTAGLTVSVSCSWSTPSSVRAVRLQRVNAQLRRLGLRSAPVVQHRPTDAVKLAIERVERLVR